MNSFVLRLALFLVIVPWIAAQDAPVPGSRLAGLDAQYSAVIELNIDKPHLARVAELDASYTGALERAMQAAARDKNLKEALALRDEIQRVADKEPLPETDAGAAPSLAKLRGTYREALGKLLAARRQAAAPVLGKFTAALAALQDELTQAGQLDDASAVAEYRTADLAEKLLGVGPVATVTPAVAGKPTGVAASATKDQPFENHLGMRFAPVPIAGGPTSGKMILFSVWETRVKDYAEFVADEKRDWPKPDFPQKDTHPAVNVSWEDATAFAEWLTKEERRKKRIGVKDVYRLPSDHEWSCAVGIGKEEDASAAPFIKSGKIAGYPWGTEFPPPKGAGNYLGGESVRNPVFGEVPIPVYDDGYDRTSPVESFAADGLGLYDLSGNVFEWCQEWTDSAVPQKRVHRGGSWRNSAAIHLRSSIRIGDTPTLRRDCDGLRVVLEVGSGG